MKKTVFTIRESDCFKITKKHKFAYSLSFGGKYIHYFLFEKEKITNCYVNNKSFIAYETWKILNNQRDFDKVIKNELIKQSDFV